MTEFILPTKQAVLLTDTAIAHFDNIAPKKVVKFGVEGGGCAGFQYFWKVLESKDGLFDDDEVVEYDNFIFVVDGASMMMLIGSTVDYLTDITGSHIEVANPLASAGCGCGVSVNFK
jgi:iron-sulfur cluster assembly accessory protein